jgi:hypothetical protein
VDYAAHFYEMYVEKHKGKHLTGELVRILLLTLPFLLLMNVIEHKSMRMLKRQARRDRQ